MSVCCHVCGVKMFPYTKHKCVNWIMRLRIWVGNQIKKIAGKISGDYWKCNTAKRPTIDPEEIKKRRFVND